LIPLIELIRIKGTNTHFNQFKTSFDYDSSVFHLLALVVSPEDIWEIIWVMPSRQEDELEVTVTVTTDSEMVKGFFDIKMLPGPLDDPSLLY